MAELGFQAFDADNHYYEAPDAFTRHMDPKVAKRGVRWITVDGKERLMAGNRLWRFIPNPTFDPVSKPGALDDYFRGRNPKGQDVREAFGDLESIRPEYRDRDARLKVMDQQGLEACFMFPTLGVGAEEALREDTEALYATFHAFNCWLDEDWGFNYQDRIYAAPMLSLLDEDKAVEELAFVLGRGARILCLRAGPILHATGGRSPADPVYERFWSMVEDAGVAVGYHSGDSGYDRYAVDWGSSAEMEAFRADPFKRILLNNRPIYDTMAALVAHGLFARHPNLRVATIESGSTWVPDLLKTFKKVHGQIPHMFAEDPAETFRRHVWVSPFFEDDIKGLAGHIGVDHILMGSDWPHAEGLPDPTDYIHDLKGFDEADVRLIMHDNARALATPRVPAAV